MLSPKAVGREAASRKYDILTALATYALARGKYDQRLVLRVMALITARYNWAGDELSVGQREIARMWSVDERTVKRDMAKLRVMGWLIVKRQAARGRVTQYRIDFDRVRDDTRADWSRVGTDFDLRMKGQGVDPSDKIVPMPPRGTPMPAPMADGSDWSLVQGILHSEDPALYSSWFHALDHVGRQGGRLILRAPSRFHAAYVQSHLTSRILTAYRAMDESVSEVVIAE